MDANDPFSEIQTRIENTFQSEIAAEKDRYERAIAPATARREKAIELLAALRSACPIVDITSPEKVNGFHTATENQSGMDNGGESTTLKSAIVEAINAMEKGITRSSVMRWVGEKYPHLKNPNDGTLASTFSRIKAKYLEEVENEKFIYRKKGGSLPASI